METNDRILRDAIALSIAFILIPIIHIILN